MPKGSGTIRGLSGTSTAWSGSGTQETEGCISSLARVRDSNGLRGKKCRLAWVGDPEQYKRQEPRGSNCERQGLGEGRD